MDLEKLKLLYFHSNQLYVKNYLKVKGTQLPDGVVVDDLLHWNAEKREFLEQEEENIRGLSNRHVSVLLELLDTVGLLNDRLFDAAVNVEEAKDLSQVARALTLNYDLYTKIVDDLEINTFIDNEFAENIQATEAMIDRLIDSVEQNKPANKKREEVIAE